MLSVVAGWGSRMKNKFRMCKSMRKMTSKPHAGQKECQVNITQVTKCFNYSMSVWISPQKWTSKQRLRYKFSSSGGEERLVWE